MQQDPLNDLSLTNNDEGKNNKSTKNTNIFKIATIISSIVALCGIMFGICCIVQLHDKNDQINNLTLQMTERDEQIALLQDNQISPDGESSESEQSSGSGESENKQPSASDSGQSGLYWNLDKIGMRIPITQELANNITVVEIDDGYRLDFNLITGYRKEGHCGNGGSPAFGTITKNTVSRGFVENDPVLYSFINNVIYPETYIAYNWFGDFTMCRDFGEGGEARQNEVEQAVQKFQNPLTEAIGKIEPIK